jgi:hypothetical protein
VLSPLSLAITCTWKEHVFAETLHPLTLLQHRRPDRCKDFTLPGHGQGRGTNRHVCRNRHADLRAIPDSNGRARRAEIDSNNVAVVGHCFNQMRANKYASKDGP